MGILRRARKTSGCILFHEIRSRLKGSFIYH